MSKFCIVCREEPAVEGSRLCQKHRAQAAMFTTSIVEEPETAAEKGSPAVNRHESPTVRRGRPAQEEEEPPPGNGKPPQEWGNDDVSAYLERELTDLRRWVRDELDTDTKWPKLVVYCLRGTMMTRRFYGLLPRGKEEQPPAAAYTLDDVAMKAALDEGGVVHSAFAESLFEHRDGLVSRETETLSLSFLTHRGSVEVSAQSRGQADHTLVRYELADGEFKRSEAD